MPSMTNNPILRLDLSINEINAILAALQELPGKVCNPISDKIKLQATNQAKPADPAAE